MDFLSSQSSVSCVLSIAAANASTDRMKRPDLGDWELWRADIVRRYRTESAPMIVKSLRKRGYNVTLKMLRDRLRAWKATTKTQRSVAAARVAQPSRAVNTAADNCRERHVMKEIARWFEVALKHDEEHPEEGKPDMTLLFAFGKATADAMHPPYKPRSWRVVGRLADQVAALDWSSVTPAAATYLLLRCIVLLKGGWFRHFASVWELILTKRTAPGHPHALVLRHIFRNIASEDLWDAIYALGQSRVFSQPVSHKQSRSMAMSRLQLANLLIENNEGARAEQILPHSTALGSDVEELPDADRVMYSDSYAMLGRTNYYQKRYANASRYFRQAQALNTASNHAYTILNATFLAESLCQTNEGAEANEVLEKLCLQLVRNSQVPGRSGFDRQNADDQLGDLCEGLEDYKELQAAVLKLKSLRLSWHINQQFCGRPHLLQN